MPSLPTFPTAAEIDASVRSGVTNHVDKTYKEVTSLLEEIKIECTPDLSVVNKDAAWDVAKWVRSSIHVPFFPAFHKPGWLLRYVVGPYDDFWAESALADIWAGITVALLLIPQALSYATLAQMPPINGLYASVLPSAVYIFFGSSMQLAVGGVAIVCLLMGSLVSKYKIENASEDSVLFGGEVALAVGAILAVLSVLNFGNFIRYISYPVMSGFTSAAACLIGMNQVKDMFGLINTGGGCGKSSGYIPQTGDCMTHENWQVMGWISDHWKDVISLAPSAAPTPVPTLGVAVTSAAAVPSPAPTPWGSVTVGRLGGTQIKALGAGKININPYAVAICFSLWIILAMINSAKKRFKETPERKKKWCFKTWQILASISPFFAIVIGSGISAAIKKSDDYNNWYTVCDRNPNVMYGVYSPTFLTSGTSYTSAETLKACPPDAIYTVPGEVYAICDAQVGTGKWCKSSAGSSQAVTIDAQYDYQANPNTPGSDCFWYLKYNCDKDDVVGGAISGVSVPSKWKNWYHQGSSGTAQVNVKRWTLDPATATNHNYYKHQLSIVGSVTPGLNILRTPQIKWPFAEVFVDVIPLTLIAFMESWSVARKLAVLRNELHILNASQEMWAIGLANLLASVSSAFPVAGSFSRSSLNATAGARTPFSKICTLIVILITLGSLTDLFYYIPKAALAAVIMASISGLIDVRDFWNAWKYSKKDFFIMSVTAAVTFVIETSWGLLAGIGVALAVYLYEVTFSSDAEPKRLFTHHNENNGVEVVKLESDLVYLTSSRIKDFLAATTLEVPPGIDKDSSRSEYLFHVVSTGFDYVIQPNLIKPFTDTLPVAVVVDFASVRILDITGSLAIGEWSGNARAQGIAVVLINTSPYVTKAFTKFGIKSDTTRPDLNLDQYADKITLPIRKWDYKKKVEVAKAVDEEASWVDVPQGAVKVSTQGDEESGAAATAAKTDSDGNVELTK